MRGKLVASLLAVALLVALVGQTVRLGDRVRASRVLRQVELVTVELARRNRLPPALLWRQVRLLEEAARLDPTAAEIELARGGQLLLLGRPEEAVEAYARALAIEPRPEIYLNLGRALAASGDEAAALDAFERAIVLAPGMLSQVPAASREAVRDRIRSGGRSGPATGER